MAEDPRNLPPTAPTKTSPTDPKIPTPAQPSGPPPPPSVKQPPPPPRVAKAPARPPSSRAPTSIADAVGLQEEKKRRLAEQQLAEAAARGDENSELEWLTYETRCNSAEMIKGNKGLAYGLFALPFDDLVQIAALDDLPQVLVDAFFPGMTKDDILRSSRETTPWKNTRSQWGIRHLFTPPITPANRQQNILNVTFFVMPYNFAANDVSSDTIGTNLEGDTKKGYRLKKEWTMWETASRSSAVKVKATTIEELRDKRDQNWSPGRDIRIVAPPFKLASDKQDCFSIKTGVRWVGSEQQSGKMVLDSNSLLASMRSDWVDEVERSLGADPELTILREILTVTYPNRAPSIGEDVRDGYQIRDLSPLKADMIYFPPLSIPFSGEAFVAKYNEKHPDAQTNFVDFWRVNYAEAVGRAKARLLLRFGLQLTTPNPQNFLLEFNRATLEPTGKVIIRDIGDAKLHSEFITQLCGLSPSPPAVIDYEMNNPDHHHYLPAQTNNEGRVGDTQDHSRFSNYPLNTRFHWHQYSSFKDKYGLAKIPGKAKTVTRWGRAHNEAYMKCLADALAIPALALKVDSLEVCQAVHVDSSAKVWVSEAKGALAKFGNLSLDNILNDRTLSEQGLINIERAIEEITAELFHQYLTGGTTQEGVQSWLVDRSLEVVDRELANLPH